MGNGYEVVETISGWAFQDCHLAHRVARHVGEIHQHAEPVHLQDNLKYFIELTSPVSPHLLPELAEPTDPGGEVANLNLRGVRPWCVAPVGQSHVARSHPVQGAHQRQAASDGVAGLNTNLLREGQGLEIIANMETNQAGNFPFSLRRLDVRHAGRPVQVFRIS